MFKNIKWWQLELVLDVAAITCAVLTSGWGLLAAYFAIGYYGQKLVTYLENN